MWREVCRRARARLQAKLFLAALPQKPSTRSRIKPVCFRNGETGSRKAPLKAALALADVGEVGRASVLEL
jgi:hypothetical protein